jgi:hypothetical protein
VYGRQEKAASESQSDAARAKKRNRRTELQPKYTMDPPTFLADALGEAGVRICLLNRALVAAEASGASPEVAGLVEVLDGMWQDQLRLMAALGAPYKRSR